MQKRTFRILVVDDYEPWRRWVCSALQKQPEFQIVGEVSDSSDAVWKAQAVQPDLILLDISLPSLNGIEAARRIRQHSSHLKILFFSNNCSPDVAEEALKTGAEGYVVKSDAASDLLPAVTAVLQGKKFVSRRLGDHGFADFSDTASARERGHVVQFYADDSCLLDSLCRLFKDALSKGDSIAAVMTMSH
jgi:DNA-binding NarL/FixJ family response regulator